MIFFDEPAVCNNCKPVEGQAYIYTLADPITGEVRYIGRTTRSLRERYNGHKSNSKKDKTHKIDWMKSLFKDNLQPIVQILDIVNYEEQSFWEVFYIDLFTSWNFNLTNSTREIQGILKHTNEAKDKVSKALLGRKHSEERNKQKSISLRKAFLENPEYGEKISQSAKLKFSNPDNILKMVIAKGGKEFKVYKVNKDKTLTYLFNRINKTHCAKELQIARATMITRVLNKTRKHTKNYYFEYIDEIL